jgi:hypothetical protein
MKFKMQNAECKPARACAGWVRLTCCVHFAFCILHCPSSAFAQELLDRVVARVNGSVILLTDMRAAVGLGLVEGGTDPVQGVIERQLQLAEVARFPPPEPSAAAIDAELARLKAGAGPGLGALMASTELNEDRLRELARESLRIQAYLDQRFGASAPVSEDQALQYYRDHPAEFTSNGVTLSFDEVAATARQKASLERRRTTVDQWLRDLKRRAEIVINDSK